MKTRVDHSKLGIDLASARETNAGALPGAAKRRFQKYSTRKQATETPGSD